MTNTFSEPNHHDLLSTALNYYERPQHNHQREQYALVKGDLAPKGECPACDHLYNFDPTMWGSRAKKEKA